MEAVYGEYFTACLHEARAAPDTIPDIIERAAAEKGVHTVEGAGQAVTAALIILRDGQQEVPEELLVSVGSCGVAWTTGDMIVKCRTCQKDPTCAICMACFDEELHKGHDWSWQRAAGGMCDCGDATAWEPSGFCKKHKGVTDETDPTEHIPADILKRTRACVEGLVRVALANCKGMDQALDMTQEMINANVKPDALAKVVSAGLLRIAELSHPTARIVTEGMCKGMETAQHTQCLQYALLRLDALDMAYSAKLEDALYNFYLRTMIDFHMRFCFALQYIRNANEFSTSLRGARHRKGRDADLWMNMIAVQFLSVPSVVQRLQAPNPEILSPGLFHAFTKSLVRVARTIAAAIPQYRGILVNVDGLPSSVKLFFPQTFGQHSITQTHAELHHLVIDLRMCLRIGRFSYYCLSETVVLKRLLIVMLTLQQGFAVHREDSDKTGDFGFTYRFHYLVEHLAEGVANAPSVDAIVGIFEVATTFARAYAAHTLTHRDIEATLPWLHVNDPYSNAAHGIAFDLPLHRFFSGMLQAAIMAEPTRPIKAYIPDGLREMFDAFMEPIVTLFAARAQVVGGMWNRNHMGIQVQVQYHTMSNLDKDLFLLQVAAALGPSSLAVHLAHRFSQHQPMIPSDTDTEREHNVLGSFLRLILNIVTSREKVKRTNDTLLRADVVCGLATGARLFSDLQKAMAQRTRKDTATDDDEGEYLQRLKTLLADVADTSQQAQGTMFSLKNECWAEVNPYDTSLSETDMQQADAEYTRVCGKKGDSLVVWCRDPTGLQPEGDLKAVVGLLHTEVVITIALAVLAKAAHPIVTEVMVRGALDVLYLALMTQKDMAEAWSTVQRAEQKFEGSRRAMDGVRALIPECTAVDWEAYRVPSDSGLGPVDIGKLLAAPAHSGTPPAELVASILRMEKLKDLHPTVRRLLATIAASSDEGASVVARCEESLKEGTQGAEKDKAKARKAKGKAKQKAAMKALQSNKVELDFDSDDLASDGDGDAEAAPAARSAHDDMDVKWVDEENCCVCNMALSPHNNSECGMIALASCGRGMAPCFRPLPGGNRPSDEPERKRHELHDDGEIELSDNMMFRSVVDHKAQMEVVHTCGHIVHLDCLEAHYKQAKVNSNMQLLIRGQRYPYEFRGNNVLNVDANEYLCPLCGRLGNAVIPILAPNPPAKCKARAHDFAKLLTSVADDEEEGLARGDDELEELFRDIIDDPDSCSTAAAIEADKGQEAFLHTMCNFHTQLGTTLYGEEGEREGAAANAWAQQIVAAEVATRLGSAEEGTVSGKKLIALRAQLKAFLAGQDYKLVAGNADALKVLLHMDDDGIVSGYPLLTCDIFGIWTQITLGVTLRASSVGHAGHRYITRRCIEAQLTKLVVQLVAAGHAVECCDLEGVVATNSSGRRGQKKPARPAEPLDVEEYLHKEMSVFYAWLVVANSVILAPLGVQEGVVLPRVEGGAGTAADTFARLARQLDGMLRLGDAYLSLSGVAMVIEERKGEVAAVDSWIDALQQRRALMQPAVQSYHPPGLVSLPDEYRSVMSRYYNAGPKTCKGNPPLEPALCLSCGNIICWCAACSAGGNACSTHARTCGGGVSVFLMVKASCVIAADVFRHSEIPSIYLDENGEEDRNLKRGRQLFLSKQRYDNLVALHTMSQYLFETSIIEKTKKVRGRFANLDRMTTLDMLDEVEGDED